MRILKHILLLLPVVLLTACFGRGDDVDTQKKTPSDIPSTTVVTPEEQLRASEEFTRVNSLSELNSQNLVTQIAEQDGKKQLINKRLFINFLLKEKIATLGDLESKFATLLDFAKNEGLELTEADKNVILLSYKNENKDYQFCADFAKNKSQLKSGSALADGLSVVCLVNIPVTQDPSKDTSKVVEVPNKQDIPSTQKVESKKNTSEDGKKQTNKNK